MKASDFACVPSLCCGVVSSCVLAQKCALWNNCFIVGSSRRVRLNQKSMDIPNEENYSVLNRLCREAKQKGADAVLIHHPEVLGDNYEELVTNLNKLAQAGLALKIVPPSERKLS